jgi:6-pyruvoyltetrahydropterin/6-carboxytetrahydropterin synthase
MKYQSTKVIELGSCAFRQWRAGHSHCRFVHGYQLIAKFWFGGNQLDDKNWLVDFGGLKGLKAKLQDVFDHTTCVAGDDPELETFKDLDRKGIIQLRIFKDGVGIERTAETVFNIAQEYISNLTVGRCWVEKVEVFEHEDNSATYSNQPVAQPAVINGLVDENPATALVAPETRVEDQSVAKQGALVGGNVSSGKGNWFAGTSWG